MRYSLSSLIANTLNGHKSWPVAWRKAEPRPAYDAIIVGGGGHGLATAYYLAKEHGLTNVAVLEKGWLGSGNIGRNTTIIRSNYMLPGNTHFYEWSLKLWETLSRELNFNAMVSQRGVINLAHTPAQLDAYARRGNACASPVWMPNSSTGPSWRGAYPVSTCRMAPASRCSAGSVSRAAAPYATTRWPGVMPAPLTGSASTSSRIAR